MKHFHFNLFADFTACEIDASDNEFKIIADYLQDVGFLSKKNKKTVIDRLIKTPGNWGAWLNNENHMLMIATSPCKKGKNVNSKKSNGNAKLYRIGADKMGNVVENPDMAFLDEVKDKNLTFNQTMGIIRKCLPVLYSENPIDVVSEIDNIYKQMSGFEPGFVKGFLYTSSFPFKYIEISRVA